MLTPLIRPEPYYTAETGTIHILLAMRDAVWNVPLRPWITLLLDEQWRTVGITIDPAKLPDHDDPAGQETDPEYGLEETLAERARVRSFLRPQVSA